MKKKKLSSLCNIKNGYAFKSKDYVPSGYRVIRITNVQKGLVVDDDPKFIPASIAEKASKFKLELGDILISLTGNVGRVGRIQLCHLPAVLNQRVGLIRPTSNNLDDDFLFQYLNSVHFEREAIANANGMAQLNLSSKWVENYEIPLPPLDDQKRIAHLLGKVEELITQRKQHLQQLDELLKSVFLEMFGDPVRNEKGWETKTLPQLVLPGKHSLKRGPFGGALKKEIFVDSGYLVYEQNHALNNDYSFGRYFISEEKYNELINFKVLPNDILISCSGVYLGKLSIVPEGAKPGIINQALLKVSLNPEKIKHIFFVHVFSRSQFKNKYFPSNRGGAIPNLPPMVEMKKIPFISPPLTLQNQFAAIVEKVEDIKSQYQQSLTELENLYGALSQKAFKGELDLSRVPLVKKERDEQQGKESDMKAEEMTEEETRSIELPEPADLSSLAKAAGRRDAIENWLASYLAQLDGKAFDVGQFMQLAQLKLNELIEDEPPELGVAEYDWIKERVFQLLENAQMTQNYDDDGNRVLIKGQGNSQS